MSITSLTTIAIVGAVVLVALIALALFKTGFRLEELKFKLGLAEAKLGRKPGHQAVASGSTGPAAGTEQVQEASGSGSLISGSPQQAGAAGTRQTMRAIDGGKIKDSGQTAAAPAGQQQEASQGGVIKDSSQRVD